MPQIDVADRTWIAAPQAVVAREVADPENWRAWWPDLDLTVTLARGLDGVQWAVNSATDRADGTMEIWLQQMFDGTLLHYFIRLDLIGGAALTARHSARIRRRLSLHAKQVFWPLKDRLEGRPAPQRR